MGTSFTWTSAHFSVPVLGVMLLAALCGGVACKSSTGACHDWYGCLCPAKEEGKSICLGCGQGYRCSGGHRIYFSDGECDAHSAACGYSPEPCPPMMAVGERTLCMCGGGAASDDVGSKVCQTDMTLSDCICSPETRYCSLAGGRCGRGCASTFDVTDCPGAQCCLDHPVVCGAGEQCGSDTDAGH